MERDDVECSDCAASQRCWQQRVPSGAGFLVRRVRPLEAGEVLVSEGEAYEAPYVITSGCVILTELLEHGAERIAGCCLPGDILGLESLDRQAWRYGARAVTSASVCRLRWSRAGISGASTAVVRMLLAKSAARLEQSAQPWAGLRSVDRVRHFIEDFARRSDQPLPLTRAQIGQYLGIAEETVVRALADLRRGSAGQARARTIGCVK